MRLHECTENLTNLINNINHKSFKNKICTNIADHVISTTDKKIADLYMSLEKNNESIRPNTNHYIPQKYFLLCSIVDINN